MIKHLKTIHSSDVFPKSEIAKPEKYADRKTVKAIVLNANKEIALVTNPVHNLYSFPGGGAESDNLEQEIIRECLEEINQEVKITGIIGVIEEFRDRDAKRYINTCFVATAVREVKNDTRTEDEAKNGLNVVWVNQEKLKNIFEEQNKKVRSGEVSFYNTAFNIIRDNEFLKEYLRNYSEYQGTDVDRFN